MSDLTERRGWVTVGGMKLLNKLRRQTYRAARDMGNIEAASKGPTAYGKRVVRRKAYRSVNKQLGRVLRKWGLG